ncbi:MAG: 30S ribosomal protein S20 [Thermaerobacter sp.]|nr:30S ribosomal protein S20 [Thermaerobacter sp.]MDA8146428.1 30S ribosomal protein S20 [Thermaerobacter sp.]
MANHKSALKRVRIAEERRTQNRARKSAVHTAERRFLESAAAGDADKAREALRRAYSTIDHAAQKGALHANTAARKKARLSRKLAAG